MQNLKDQLSNTVQSVIDGQFSAIQAFTEMKALEKHLSECMDRIKSDAITEASKYPKGEVINGFKVEVSAAAGRWDFSGISSWNHTKEALKEIEERAKAAWNAKQKDVMLVSNDGEVLELPVYLAGADTLKLTQVRK